MIIDQYIIIIIKEKFIAIAFIQPTQPDCLCNTPVNFIDDSTYVYVSQRPFNNVQVYQKAKYHFNYTIKHMKRFPNNFTRLLAVIKTIILLSV